MILMKTTKFENLINSKEKKREGEKKSQEIFNQTYEQFHMICARKKRRSKFTVKIDVKCIAQRKKRMKSEKCLLNCLWVCEKHIFLSNVKSMIYIFLKMISRKSIKSMKAAMMIFQFWYNIKKKTNMLQSDYYVIHVLK